MRISRIAFSCVLCAGMALSGMEKGNLPAPPETRGWRSAAVKGEEQTFKPVLGTDSIRFGNKTLKLLPSGEIQCMTPEHGILFTTGMPFYTVKNKHHEDWNIRHLDRERSKFRREGNKYIWELWYKRDNVEPFQGISQSLEVLPDGRLLYVSNYQLPADTPELKLKTWTFGFQLKDNNWLNEKIDLDGKIRTLDQKFPQYRTERDRKEENCVFGADDPAKKFGVHMELGKEAGMRNLVIYRQGKRKHFEVRFYKVSKKHPYKIYFDFRRGAAEGSTGESRGGVNFKAIENLEMPDDSRRNLLQNSSFECGLQGYTCLGNREGKPYWEGKWEWKPFEIVEDPDAPFGKHVLRFNAKKGHMGEKCSAISPHPVVVPAGTYTISFYAKGEDGCSPQIFLFATGFLNGKWLLNKDARKHFRPDGQWKRYSLTFRMDKAQPLEFCISAESKDRDAYVLLDGLQLEHGSKATAYEPAPAEGRLITSSPENFVSAKEKIDGRMIITTAKPDLSGKVSIRVKNFFGEELLKREIPFRSDASGTAGIALPLDELPGLGVFVLRADYQLADGTRAYEHHRYAKMAFLDNTHPNKSKFAFDYMSPERHFLFIPILERWKKLGVGAKHHHYTFDRKVMDMERRYGVEPTNTFMMSFLVDDESLKNRRKMGFGFLDADQASSYVRPDDPRLLIRDFYLDSDGTITPEYLKKMQNAVKTITARYPHIPMWVMAGEVLCKFPPEWWSKEKTPEACAKIHAQLLKAFVDGVREGNPKAKVFQDDPYNMTPAGGIAETERLLRETNKLGVKFDVIAIHPYRKSPEDPDLDGDTKLLLQMLGRVGYDKVPVLWPEMMHWGPYDIPQWGTESSSWHQQPRTWRLGPLSYDMGATERKSAAWYMRSWLVVLKYGDRILGATAGNTSNNCFMDLMLTPYAAQLVPNTLGNVLGDAVFKKDIRFAPFIRAFVFEDGQKRPVAAVWCHQQRTEDGFTDNPVAEADFGDTLESVIDFMNSPRAFNPGNFRFPVNSFPLFLRGKPGTLEQMISALESANIVSGEGIAPLDVLANPVNREEVGIRVRNYVSRPFKGTLNGKALNIPASGQTEVVLPLSQPLDYHAVTKIPLPVEIRNANGGGYRYDLTFEALPAKHVPEGVTFETVEWSKIPSIPFVRKMGTGKTSGSFRIGWNKLGIFIEAAVKDKTFVHTEYEKTSNRWNNDCLQIYFDTLANARVRILKGYDEDDYDYAVFPNAAGNSSIVYRYRSVEQQLGLATQAPPDNTVAPDIPSSFSNENGILTYRVFFPAKYLLPISLRKGWVFGFGLYAADSNQKNKVEGGLTTSSDNGGCFNKPHHWPAVILE